MKPERIFDILLSSFLIFWTAPVLFIVIIISSVFIGFPPFYFSARIGKNGIPFRHMKIKTMLPGRELGRSYFEENRLNGAGSILRKYHFDELLELYSIVKGTTSFVGPRPLPSRHLRNFDTSVRQGVVPGWTCLAQIKLLRRGILLGREQIKLDSIYAKKKSLHYNIQILTATICSFFKRKQPVTDPEYNRYRKDFHESI